MKKSIISVISLNLISMIFLSGCFEFGGSEVEDDEFIDGKESAIIMTAKEHNADIPLDLDWNDGYSLLYNSLENGDFLIIQDTINDIYYDKNNDTTTVIFEWTEDDETDFLCIAFEGDITILYKSGDEVKISVTIKYVIFSYESFNFEMEIYEEQWESEEYFRSDVASNGDGFKPLPQSCIEKA